MKTLENKIVIFTIIIVCLFVYGVFLILADILNFSSKKAKNILIKYRKNTLNKNSVMDLITFNLATLISNFVKINSYKKNKLKTNLLSAGINMSPELYVANAIAKGTILLPVAFIFLFIFPIVSIIILILSVLFGLQEYAKLDSLLEVKRNAIEYDLARFVANIKQSSSSTKDIYMIMKNYKPYACKEFQFELEITLADMDTGSSEIALTRFEGRVGSSMFSNLIRGMLSVLRGDSGYEIFAMLEHDFRQIELQKLKKLALKRPDKIKKYSLFIMFAIVFNFVVVLLYQMVFSMGSIL